MTYSTYKAKIDQKEVKILAKGKKEKEKEDEDEIDLIELAKTLWGGRKTVIITTIAFALLGIVVALLTPKVYTANSTMIPQTSKGSSNLGGLSSLASMAGFNINLNAGAGEISPLIYPLILQSTSFQLEIMNTEYHFPDQETPVSLYTYFTEISQPSFLSYIKKYTIGLPGVLRKSISSEDSNSIFAAEIPQFTKEQDKIRKILSKNIILDFSDKDGYMTLSTNFYDPVLAAEVAEKTQQLLQQYITELKIEKATAQLEFIESRYTEKKKEFEKTQATLAEFRDRNKNVTNAMALTEESRLENEYQLAFNVYSELATQLEQARIHVKEDTPVFSIIQPVIVPRERSKPKRAMILFIWTFFGGAIGIGLVFGKKFLIEVKEKWNQ